MRLTLTLGNGCWIESCIGIDRVERTGPWQRVIEYLAFESRSCVMRPRLASTLAEGRVPARHLGRFAEARGKRTDSCRRTSLSRTPDHLRLTTRGWRSLDRRWR